MRGQLQRFPERATVERPLKYSPSWSGDRLYGDATEWPCWRRTLSGDSESPGEACHRNEFGSG
jgi:hypothetical protein